MTETYILLNKGRVDPNNFFENDYVTYTTPSPEDKDWSLTFREASSPRTPIHPSLPHSSSQSRPLYYYAVWRYINDEQAREDYPIFNRLASARNWAPIESRPIPAPAEPPCPHSRTTIIGQSSTSRRLIYRCLKCNALLFQDGSPIEPGVYSITHAPTSTPALNTFDKHNPPEGWTGTLQEWKNLWFHLSAGKVYGMGDQKLAVSAMNKVPEESVQAFFKAYPKLKEAWDKLNDSPDQDQRSR